MHRRPIPNIRHPLDREPKKIEPIRKTEEPKEVPKDVPQEVTPLVTEPATWSEWWWSWFGYEYVPNKPIKPADQ
jgi:hypothetical protein